MRVKQSEGIQFAQSTAWGNESDDGFCVALVRGITNADKATKVKIYAQDGSAKLGEDFVLHSRDDPRSAGKKVKRMHMPSRKEMKAAMSR